MRSRSTRCPWLWGRDARTSGSSRQTTSLGRPNPERRWKTGHPPRVPGDDPVRGPDGGTTMRTLHPGLRVADPERSIAFYTALGYEVLGSVPGTELGTLTMLKLPGDEFVALELVHDPTADQIDVGGLSHLVVQ